MRDQILILLILSVLLIFFIWDKFRYDLIAVSGLLLAVLTGIIPPSKAFEGFGHPATIIVALVLIFVYAISRSGATDFMEPLIKKTAKNTTLHILTLCVLTGGLSLFINDIAALAIFMPIAISTAKKAKRPVALVLMPISFAALLGGMGTLIGTPPNVIISNYRELSFGQPFLLFDYAPVGGLVALFGVIFIALIGWRLIKVREIKYDQQSDAFEIESYIAEVLVTNGSSLCGKSIKDIDKALENLDLVLFPLIRHEQRFEKPTEGLIIQERDILLIEGGPESIDKFVSQHNLEIIGPERVDKKILHNKGSDTFEVVVPPYSSVEGRLVKNIHLQRRYSVSLLGISRKGMPYRGRLHSFRLQTGDVLLVHGEPENITEMITSLSLLPLAERKITFGRRKNDGIIVLAFFFAAILLSAFNILSIQIALSLAIVGVIMARVIPIREIYAKIDWPVVVLIGALLPVGEAFERTGATQLITNGLLSVVGGVSAVTILALVLIITMMLTDILHNTATAIIMAPIGKVIAEQLSVNPDAFLIAIAMGASCAFLTPIGHQNNALIMGVGGYRFGDYWRLGLPLKILILAFGMPLLLYFWPLSA